MSNHDKYGIVAEDIAHIGIYVVDKRDPIDKVVQLMDEKSISGVMVEDKDDLQDYYIISHSDIIQFINNNQRYIEELIKMDLNPMVETKAKDIMRGPIDIMPRETPIDEIIQKLHVKGWKRIFVGNDRNQPIGIITLRDLLSWNSDFFRKGNPILICVMENSSGLILTKKFFRQEFSEELLELFGGSLNAIKSITSEVLKKSGNLRVIEKDYYVIMLEPDHDVTAVMVADYQSIDLRRKLQTFLHNFVKKYKKDILKRRTKPGSMNVFRIGELSEIFR